MTLRLAPIALLFVCGSCTEPVQPPTQTPRPFVAVLRVVDTMHGAPFRTADITCNAYRAVAELLYDSLIFGPQGHVERHRAHRIGSVYAPDTALTWTDPEQTDQVGEYELAPAIVTAYWACPTGCGRDNRQTFQRVDSTGLAVEGAVGGGCFVNGHVVDSDGRDVPFRYQVTYLALEGVRSN